MFAVCSKNDSTKQPSSQYDTPPRLSDSGNQQQSSVKLRGLPVKRLSCSRQAGWLVSLVLVSRATELYYWSQWGDCIQPRMES